MTQQPSPPRMDLDIVMVKYTNHKGVKRWRKIRPIRIYFGSTAHHSEPQWLMECFDLDKQATRDYAMEGIVEWIRAVDEPLLKPGD